MFKKIIFGILIFILFFTRFQADKIIAAGNNFLIAPYIRELSYNKALIIWENKTNCKATVYYGDSAGKYSHSINIKPSRIHRVYIKNLNPGKVYYYYIKTEYASTPKYSRDFFFRTPSDKMESFMFAVFGDTASGKGGFDLDFSKVVQSINEYSIPEILIMPGDLVIDGTKKENWVRFFDIQNEIIRNVPIFAVMGNNDIGGAKWFRRYFRDGENDLWYSFDYNNCHFIALHILRGKSGGYYKQFRPGNPQFKWLLEDLKSRECRDAKFNFVFFHAPIYSPDGKKNEVLEQLLHPLFLEYGVDIVFNGTHSFTHAVKDDILYLISGGGGSELNPVRMTKPVPQIKDVKYFHHHLRINVKYPVLNIEAVDIHGNIHSSITYWKKRRVDGDVNKMTDYLSVFEKEIKTNSIKVTIFSLPKCKYCNRLKEKIIPGLTKKLKIDIKINYLSLDNAENFEKLVYIENHLEDIDNELPVILIGNTIIGGEKEISSELNRVIIGYINSSNNSGFDFTGSIRDDVLVNIINKFSSLKIVPVFTAGVLDGINPCAFTVIIFLISYLIFTGKEKSKIILTGLSFSAGVFITYLFLGAGLWELITLFAVYDLISVIIRYSIIACVFIVGIINIYDFIVSKKGEMQKVRIKLPKSIQKNIHAIVRKNIRTRYFYIILFFTGLVVSLFELACTGQIYVPTILYVIRTKISRLKAFLYLIFYNIAFILPLLFVFFLVYFGINNEKIKAVFARRIALIKLLTAILLFGLGLFIVLN